MNEINIILNTNIEEFDSNILKNDKQILFESLNRDLHLVHDKYKNDLKSYKLLDYIYMDDFLEFYNDLYINKMNETMLSKKVILKKLFEFSYPIIDINNIFKGNQTNKYNNSFIVDKDKFTLNYPIDSKYIISNSQKEYIIPPLNNFNVKGIFNKNKLYYNVPYKYNQFSIEINNVLKYSSKFTIYNKKLNYLNGTIKDINKLEVNDLISLYDCTINRFKLIYNNKEINKLYIDSVSSNDTDKASIFISKNIDSNIEIYNTFLKNKISKSFNNNTYYSFYNDNLLNLYEDILIYTLDNKKIKNKIDYIKNYNVNTYNYNIKLKDLDNDKFIFSKLEYITKNKFPNLFNVNSKECIFNNFNKFDIKKVPKKIKDVVLLELKKNTDYVKNYLYNKCIHKNIINQFYSSNNNYELFMNLSKFIDTKSPKNEMYKCNTCSFNLICPHEHEYYSMLFSKKFNNSEESPMKDKTYIIHQKILNKYMTYAPVDMIYYCKICGEELGKSSDIEQNIINYDQPISFLSQDNDEITKVIISIVYPYVKFIDINIKLNKYQIVSYIYNIIRLYIDNIEKKIRKNKSNTNEKIKDIIDFNIIIFTYATLVFLINNNTYIDFVIPFKKNIIIKKGSKANDRLKEKFKIAYDLIIKTNYQLLQKLEYFNKTEIIKEILVKSYSIVSTTTDVLDIKYKTDDNFDLINTSSIYNYYYNIINLYPLISKISSSAQNKNRRHMSYYLNFKDEFISNNKKIKFEDYKTILNKISINKNPEYIFDSFIIPKFGIDKSISDDIANIKEINNFNEYKYYSMLLFNYYIKQKYFEHTMHIDDILYNKIVDLIKNYELKLIKININYNQYPYSKNKLNNERYFYKQNINLNPYICKITGKKHIYSLYVYSEAKSSDSTHAKEFILNRKELSKNVERIKNSNFIDYKCIKCNKNKKDLINDFNNKNIEELISNKNDITNFYNIYKYKCPTSDYHDFKGKTNNMQCISCKIYFNDILNNNIDIFNKYIKEYKEYINLLIIEKNNSINKYIKEQINIKNINPINEYKIESATFLNKSEGPEYKLLNISIDNYIKQLNEISIDSLISELSALSKINIKYFYILGATEGYDFEKIEDMEIKYDFIDNRFIKISNNIRTINIYYNLLINKNKLDKYHDIEFMDIIQNIKNKNLDKLELNKINLNAIFNYIKISNYSNNKLENNKYIIIFGLKILYSFILNINKINKKELNGSLNEFIIFIINKIFKTDELYTNYDYSQLKQMFIESAPNYIDFGNNDNNNDEDEVELFEYNDIDVEFGDTHD